MKNKIYNSDDLYLVKKYVMLRKQPVFYKYSVVEYKKTSNYCMDVENEIINNFNETKVGFTYIDKKTMICLGEILGHKKITKQLAIELLHEFIKMTKQEETAITIANELTNQIKTSLLEDVIQKMKKIIEEESKSKNIERTRKK